MFAWLHVSPFTKITYILTSPAHFSEQFLRDIWEAEPWAIVLILSQVKLNSQLSHCAFFLLTTLAINRDPEQTCCLLLNFMKNQRSVPIETSCAHPPSQSSDEFRVSLSAPKPLAAWTAQAGEDTKRRRNRIRAFCGVPENWNHTQQRARSI